MADEKDTASSEQPEADEQQIPADILAELKAKHGEVWTLTLGDDVFGITMPTTPNYDRCMSVIAENRSKAPGALRTLAKGIVVYPAAPEYEALIRKRPGIPSRIAGEALKLAGAEESEFAKKS
jgi:hypothetical protein